MYELFDEVMDFGYPQFTEAKIMADYIKTDAHKADVHDVRQSMAVTNAVSWRGEGLKYKARPPCLLSARCCTHACRADAHRLPRRRKTRCFWTCWSP